MIRVLQVLGSLQRGGAETMIMNVYRKIDKRNIQFDFLLKEHVENGYESEVKKLGGKIFYVESARKIGVFNYLKKLVTVMKNNGKYDIIHSHVNTLSGIILFAAKIAGIKVRISHSHTTKQDAKILKFMIKCFATNRISCGDEAGKALFGKQEYTIIQNGIDVNNYISDNPKKNIYMKKLDISSKTLNICHIGRFVEVKNHIFIIDLAEKLRDNNIKFKLYLIGDGPLFDGIQKLVLEKGLCDYIKLIGSIPNANEYLIACDLFILPSLYEGLPVTLIEAQCSGTKSYISDKISAEADLGLKLVEFLPLNIDIWVATISKYKKKMIVDTLTIKKVFREKEYDIEISSKKVIDYYNMIMNKKGEIK